MATQTIYVNRDSYTDEYHGGDNYGTSSVLQFDRGGNGKQFYINFDITSAPAASLVTQVIVYIYRGDTVLGTPNVDLLRITGSWTESGVTWNNPPTTTTTNMLSNVSGWTSGQNYKTYTVTNMYKDAKNAGNEFGINLRPWEWGSSGATYYARSKEYDSGSSKAYIYITYGIVTDYYVKTTGNDSLSGTSWANAWKTINKAATTVADGVTVHIGFGTYDAEPAANKIAPQNVGATGIYYLPETATTGGGTGTVSVEQNT
jgi:hypothetical protein